MGVVHLAGRQNKSANPLPRSSIIAALDVGSTKISCMIAELRAPRSKGISDPRQLLHVIGMGQTASRGIRAGAVVDLHEAECAIRIAVDAAERQAQTSISQVMVSISGGRPASASYAGRVQTRTGIVSPADVEFAIVQAMSSVELRNRSVLHLHPVNYVLDGVSDVSDVLGLHGTELQADIGVTTVEPAYLRNLVAALDRAHLEPSGFIIGSYAAAKAALTPDESKLGTMVIDLGGAVTSMAFVRNGKLVAADSFNLGGRHLTNDVAQGLSTSIAHAERMKTLWGTALGGGHGDREMLAVPLLGEKGTDSVQRVPKSMLSSILRARLEEILELCAARLSSGLMSVGASSRVVLTGGASQMPGLLELSAQILQRPVRMGLTSALNGLSEHQRHGGLAASAGALIHAVQPDMQYAVPHQAELALERASLGYARRFGRWLAEAL